LRPRGSDCRRVLPSREALLETVLFEGHTNSRPVNGTCTNEDSPCSDRPQAAEVRLYNSNWGLSAGRAIQTLEHAKCNYEALDRSTNRRGVALLGAAGFGDTRLLTPEDGTQPRNRRIDIRFLMESPQLPEGNAQ